jgi:hypothetical protein
MKTYLGGGVYIQIHAFLTSALVGGEWSASRLGRFISGERARVPTGYEAGWGSESVWTTWIGDKSYAYRDSNSEPSAVQPIASRHTDCVIRLL